MESESLDAVYRSLWRVSSLEDSDIRSVADYVLRLLQSNSFSPQSWLNLFLYILEREPQAIARRNVVQIISELVLSERNSVLSERSSLLFSDLVRKEISRISHAADTGESTEVRIFLHQRIFEWMEEGIVSAQFLKELQQEEEKWKFKSDRPRYKPRPEEAPPTFDLVLLGIQGQRRRDGGIDMRNLVVKGMAQGVREGWIRVDEQGRHVVVSSSPRQIRRGKLMM